MFFRNDNLIDFLSYIYQIAVFLYAVSKCLKEERKKDVINWFASFSICMVIGLVLRILLDQYGIFSIEVHSISFFLVCGIVYREVLYDAMVAYSLCYFECLMYSITKHALFGGEVLLTFGGAISAVILMGVYLFSVNSIVEIYDSIKNQKEYRVLIIVLSFVADVFLIFDKITSISRMRALELIMFKIFLIFLILNISYFALRYFKVKRIVKLNSKLNYINNELRNIKDCHSQIIYSMYELYEIGEREEVGKILKGIINNGSQEIKNLKLNDKKNNTILDMALMNAIKDGINVSIDEGYNIQLAKIDKIELYRIISNIINNARRFVKKDGIINIKTYKKDDKIVVIIENNGPKIEESPIEKIFQAGFTTKSNNDKSHGYGLNIVKELVEKNNGYVEVYSTEIITRFTVTLPCD